jgi:AcrR family transcriptional regulator
MQPSASQLVPKRLIASSAERTRQRLLDAATQTLKRVGIQGATTREIARQAGVNEVTLFRHFKSKEQLLRVVLQRGLAAEAAILDEHSSWNENLRESLEKYARHYYSLLDTNKDFAGAFLAEGHLWPKSMQAMIADVIRRVRERSVSILADAQKAGVVRSDLNIECALDAFKNALYARMLLKGAYLPRNYSNDAYISTVVEIFVRGIEAPNNGNFRTVI